MRNITEKIDKLRSELSDARNYVEHCSADLLEAKVEVAVLEKCIILLTELVEEPPKLPAKPARDTSEPVKKKRKTKHKTQTGLVGIYRQGGRESSKFYASVTEDKKTKRLPGNFDSAEVAANYRAEYLAKRDQKQEEPEATTAAKRTFGPSNERPVC